jgi:uncharacterized protein YjiS (DUF1127 family)
MGAQPAALRWLASRVRTAGRLGAAAIARHREQIRHTRMLLAMNDRGLRDIGLFRVGERFHMERSADCCHHLGGSLPPPAEENPPRIWRNTHGTPPDQAPMDLGDDGNMIGAAD